VGAPASAVVAAAKLCPRRCACLRLRELLVEGEQEVEHLVLEALELGLGGADVGGDGDLRVAVGVEHGAVELDVELAQVLDLGAGVGGVLESETGRSAESGANAGR
jgi:hypothetical protein